MKVLDRVYLTRVELVEVLQQAQEDQEMLGQLRPETEERLAEFRAHRDDFVTDLASWFLKESARLRALKAAYDPIREQMAADETTIEKTLAFIKEQIALCLPGSPTAQIANDRAYLFYTPSASLEVLDAATIPTEFTRVEPVIKVETEKLKDFLEAGGSCEGARLNRKFNLQIKPGGPRAERAARQRLQKKTEG